MPICKYQYWILSIWTSPSIKTKSMALISEICNTICWILHLMKLKSLLKPNLVACEADTQIIESFGNVIISRLCLCLLGNWQQLYSKSTLLPSNPGRVSILKAQNYRLYKFRLFPAVGLWTAYFKSLWLGLCISRIHATCLLEDEINACETLKIKLTKWELRSNY